MARQYMLPTGIYINAEANGRQYMLPNGTYFGEEAAAAAAGNPWYYYAQLVLVFTIVSL